MFIRLHANSQQDRHRGASKNELVTVLLFAQILSTDAHWPRVCEVHLAIIKTVPRMLSKHRQETEPTFLLVTKEIERELEAQSIS